MENIFTENSKAISQKFFGKSDDDVFTNPLKVESENDTLLNGLILKAGDNLFTGISQLKTNTVWQIKNGGTDFRTIL